jgi:hypothetical protein
MDRRKVFCIGWVKTGTTTLGQALRILGFDHGGPHLDLWVAKQYASGDFRPLIAEASRYDSLEDWPWLLM